MNELDYFLYYIYSIKQMNNIHIYTHTYLYTTQVTCIYIPHNDLIIFLLCRCKFISMFSRLITLQSFQPWSCISMNSPRSSHSSSIRQAWGAAAPDLLQAEGKSRSWSSAQKRNRRETTEQTQPWMRKDWGRMEDKMEKRLLFFSLTLSLHLCRHNEPRTFHVFSITHFIYWYKYTFECPAAAHSTGSVVSLWCCCHRCFGIQDTRWRVSTAILSRSACTHVLRCVLRCCMALVSKISTYSIPVGDRSGLQEGQSMSPSGFISPPKHD